MGLWGFLTSRFGRQVLEVSQNGGEGGGGRRFPSDVRAHVHTHILIIYIYIYISLFVDVYVSLRLYGHYGGPDYG